jgi:hypothetical protein
MQREGVRYQLWDYRSDESENLAAAERALSDDTDVLFVYTAELDALMHRVGIFADAVGARLQRYTRFLEAMRHTARARDISLTTILLSDHGMTNVTSAVDPWGALNASGLKLGRDYLAFFDSTMVRVWGDKGAVDGAAAALGDAGRLLSPHELRAFGCEFPAHEYGDAVLLANPGRLIVPSFMGASVIAAMHGYHPDDAFSKGCFMSDAGPPAPSSILGFKSYFTGAVRR